MPVANATAAQRQTLRNEAAKTAAITQSFAQNAATPGTEHAARIDNQLTALAAAMAAVGATSGSALSLAPLIVPWTDSRGAQNWSTATDVPAPLSRSYLWRAEARSQRVRLDHRYSQANSGDSIKQLLARITGDVANAYGVKPSQVPACVAFVLIGTNTMNSYTTASGVSVAAFVAEALADVNLILDYLVGKGHGVILCAEWPRGQTEAPNTALLTPDAQTAMRMYAEGLRKISRKNVQVIDVLPRTLDPSKTDFTPLPNILNPDYLHNSPGIAEIVGQEIDKVLAGFGLAELPVASTTGALNSNPTLVLGTGGTLGANASGVVPQGYTLSASAGLTVVGSFVQIIVRGELRSAYKMVVSGTATGANGNAILRQSGLLGTIMAGDTLEAFEEVYVGPGAVNFASPTLMIDTGASATRLHGGLSLTGDNPCPDNVQQAQYNVARSAYGTLATLPASLSFQFGCSFTLAAASAATLFLLGAAMKKKT